MQLKAVASLDAALAEQRTVTASLRKSLTHGIQRVDTALAALAQRVLQTEVDVSSLAGILLRSPLVAPQEKGVAKAILARSRRLPFSEATNTPVAADGGCPAAGEPSDMMAE